MNGFRLVFSVLIIFLVVTRWMQYSKTFRPLLMAIKKSQIKSRITQKYIIKYIAALVVLTVCSLFLSTVYVNATVIKCECFFE